MTTLQIEELIHEYGLGEFTTELSDIYETGKWMNLQKLQDRISKEISGCSIDNLYTTAKKGGSEVVVFTMKENNPYQDTLKNRQDGMYEAVVKGQVKSSKYDKILLDPTQPKMFVLHNKGMYENKGMIVSTKQIVERKLEVIPEFHFIIDPTRVPYHHDLTLYENILLNNTKQHKLKLRHLLEYGIYPKNKRFDHGIMICAMKKIP